MRHRPPVSTDCEIYHTLSIARSSDGKGRNRATHLRDTCEGEPRSVPRGLELGARGGLGTRPTGSIGRGALARAVAAPDGFSGPPAGAAPRNRRVARVVRWDATRWSVLMT